MHARAASQAIALAAALLLAACRVDVNGAPCLVPGAATDCPDGQACGNDLRCSALALACKASRCPPGAMECVDMATARRCDAAADPVCGRWVAEACSARRPDCRIVADPRVLSPGGVRSYPDGVPEPPECRFGRLGDALAAAAERFPEPAAVRIDGEPGVAPVFGAATAEEWPLLVATSVTVAPAAPEWPPIVRGDSAGAATILAVRGAVEDVRIEGGGATGAGIAVSCGASPALRRVAVDGEGTVDAEGIVTTGLTRGITVEEGCGGRLTGVNVSGVRGPALTIDADPASASTVEVQGGSYRESNFGIWIRGGNVSLAPDPETSASVVVSENAVDGVVIGGHSSARGVPISNTSVTAVLERVRVEANGGTGILIAGLPGTSRLSLSGCDIHGNGLVRPAKYGPSAARDAGGTFVWLGQIEAFAFQGNRLWANGGDQLGFASDATWSIEPPACGPGTNVFACATGCAAGSCAVAVIGTGTASVRARFTVWPGTEAFLYTAGDVQGIDQYCAENPGVPPKPTCP